MLQYPASGGKIAKSNVKQKPKSHRMICLTEYIPECLMLDVFSVIWICVLQISQTLSDYYCVYWQHLCKCCMANTNMNQCFMKKKSRHWMHRVLKSLRVNLKKSSYSLIMGYIGYLPHINTELTHFVLNQFDLSQSGVTALLYSLACWQLHLALPNKVI